MLSLVERCADICLKFGYFVTFKTLVRLSEVIS